MRYPSASMPSPDRSTFSNADFLRLQREAALLDQAEQISQHRGEERNGLVHGLNRNATSLSAVNMISRTAREQIAAILAAVTDVDPAPR